METIIYQIIGILLGFGIIKLYQFIQLKRAQKKHKILARQMTEMVEREKVKNDLIFKSKVYKILEENDSEYSKGRANPKNR